MKLPTLNQIALAVSLMFACQVQALELLDDELLSDTTGEGIAILPENFSISFDPLAYVRAIPRGVPATGLKHADVYYYGVSLGAPDGTLTALNNMNSLTVGNIASWGTATNPWVLRVESTTNLLYSGAIPAGAGYPIFQYRAPTFTPGEGGLKYAFVGELQVCNSPAAAIGANGVSACGGGTLFTGTSAGATPGRLEMLNVWNDFTLNGSRFSIFQNTFDTSFGLTWLNRINSSATGVYRIGVAQLTASTPAGAGPRATAPAFDPDEGVFFTDLDINLPLGNLNYQPLIFTGDATGNFSIELVRIPNTAAVYTAAYRDYTGSAADLAKQCNNTTVNCGGDPTNATLALRAPATHGQITAGNISFKDTVGTTVNLGSASIDGIFFQHLKIKTLGL